MLGFNRYIVCGYMDFTSFKSNLCKKGHRIYLKNLFILLVFQTFVKLHDIII